jgi:4-amino-4-deoxy-L-arabinose transferase-like glycosyltransferase
MTTTSPPAATPSALPSSPPPTTGPAAPAPPAGRRGRAARLVRGRETDPGWVRPSLVGLLAATGLLYLWDLGASGWANAFYSAAVQAGSTSWEAFFYGSSDAGNSITVDKPPASLWVMELSVRLFGLSSWSILVPEALIGVATVGVLYLAVRRVAGPGAGILAGAVLALTPVAALMFRFDNPDALLVLLMTLAAYATVRAVERAGLRWLLGVGVLVGAAFLTKTLQAMLVVPGFALVYLVAAPTTLGRRIGHLLAAGAAMVVAGGWWVAVVELVPASARPYIGGSQTNSVWELIWGYNGLGRLTGDETGSVGGGGGRFGGTGGGQWGATGLTRLFTAEVGGQIAWLLPAALVLLVAGLVAVGRAPRTDVRRAALLVWGTWLVVTGLTFSLMAGIFHAYYTVALAPAIAGLVGTGGWLLWQRRAALWARLVLAAVVAGTGIWSFVLLDRSSTFLPVLRDVVLVAGLLAAVGLLVADRVGRAVVAGVLATAVVAGLGGPAAYAVDTAATPHTGSIPSAGPAVAGGMGGPGGFRGGAGGGPRQFGAAPGGGFGAGGFGGTPPGGTTGGTTPGGTTTTGGATTGGMTGGFGGMRGGAGGGMGGLLSASSVDAQVAAALEQDASSYTWVAAAVGANNAAGYQLATQLPVMPLGGFNGSDPSPTLAQFQADVAAGKVHWFIGSGGVGGMTSTGGSQAAQSIAGWVAAHYAAQTIGGVTMYDLTQPAS